MYKVELTEPELLALDGKCGAVTQGLIDAIRIKDQYSDLPSGAAKVIAAAVEEAIKRGKLSYQYCPIRSCGCCGKSAGYAKHKRSGRYHRKGDDDHKRPLTFAGVELADRCVSISGYATIGCCNGCFEKILPALRAALANIDAAIPETISGVPPRFKWFQNRRCTHSVADQVCGWVGHEGQMGRLRAIMGDGTYPGKCPKCGGEDSLFVNKIKIENGFTLVPIEQAKESTAHA